MTDKTQTALKPFIVCETAPCWVTWRKRVQALDAQDALDCVRGGQGDDIGEPEIGDNVDGVYAPNDIVAPDDGSFDAPDPFAGLVTATYRNGGHVETRILASAALAEEWRQEIAMRARGDRYPFVFDRAAVSLDGKATADAFFAHLKANDVADGFEVAAAKVEIAIEKKRISGWIVVDDLMGPVKEIGSFDFSSLDFDPVFRGAAADELASVIAQSDVDNVFMMPCFETIEPIFFIGSLEGFEKTSYPSP